MGTPGDLTTKLILQVKPVDVNVDAGAQIQQLVNVECVDEFLGKPFIFFCSYCNYFFFPFLRVWSMSNVDCFFCFCYFRISNANYSLPLQRSTTTVEFEVAVDN